MNAADEVVLFQLQTQIFDPAVFIKEQRSSNTFRETRSNANPVVGPLVLSRNNRGWVGGGVNGIDVSFHSGEGAALLWTLSERSSRRMLLQAAAGGLFRPGKYIRGRGVP